MKGWLRWALRNCPSTAFHASMIPVPSTVWKFKSNSLLKNNCWIIVPLPSQGQALCFCGFFLGNVEKGENLILTLIGLPFGLNKRKISNYPFDNYSLHTAAQAEKSAQRQKSSHKPGAHTCKPLSAWRQAGLWRSPLAQKGWQLLASGPRATQEAAGHYLQSHPALVHLRLQAEQKPCEKVTRSLWEIPNETPELYTCYRSRPDQSRDKSVSSMREWPVPCSVTNTATYKADDLHLIHICRNVVLKADE